MPKTSTTSKATLEKPFGQKKQPTTNSSKAEENSTEEKSLEQQAPSVEIREEDTLEPKKDPSEPLKTGSAETKPSETILSSGAAILENETHILKELVKRFQPENTETNPIISFDKTLFICPQHYLRQSPAVVQAMLECGAKEEHIFFHGKLYSEEKGVFNLLKETLGDNSHVSKIRRKSYLGKDFDIVFKREMVSLFNEVEIFLCGHDANWSSVETEPTLKTLNEGNIVVPTIIKMQDNSKAWFYGYTKDGTKILTELTEVLTPEVIEPIGFDKGSIIYISPHIYLSNPFYYEIAQENAISLKEEDDIPYDKMPPLAAEAYERDKGYDIARLVIDGKPNEKELIEKNIATPTLIQNGTKTWIFGQAKDGARQLCKEPLPFEPKLIKPEKFKNGAKIHVSPVINKEIYDGINSVNGHTPHEGYYIPLMLTDDEPTEKQLEGIDIKPPVFIKKLDGSKTWLYKNKDRKSLLTELEDLELVESIKFENDSKIKISLDKNSSFYNLISSEIGNRPDNIHNIPLRLTETEPDEKKLKKENVVTPILIKSQKDNRVWLFNPNINEGGKLTKLDFQCETGLIELTPESEILVPPNRHSKNKIYHAIKSKEAHTPEQKIEKVIILDDGAKAILEMTRRLNDEEKQKPYVGLKIGAVEQTSNGEKLNEQIKTKENLKQMFTIALVCSSAIKGAIEPDMIHEQLYDRVIKEIEKLYENKEKPTVGIIGMGRIGEKIAEELTKAKYEIITYDTDSEKNVAGTSLSKLVSRSEFIIGCTGYGDISEEFIEELKNVTGEKCFMSVSSGDKEMLTLRNFLMKQQTEDKFGKVVRDPLEDVVGTINGHEIKILFGGFPVTFRDVSNKLYARGAPLAKFQSILTVLVGSLFQAWLTTVEQKPSKEKQGKENCLVVAGEIQRFALHHYIEFSKNHKEHNIEICTDHFKNLDPDKIDINSIYWHLRGSDASYVPHKKSFGYRVPKDAHETIAKILNLPNNACEVFSRLLPLPEKPTQEQLFDITPIFFMGNVFTPRNDNLKNKLLNKNKTAHWELVLYRPRPWPSSIEEIVESIKTTINRQQKHPPYVIVGTALTSRLAYLVGQSILEDINELPKEERPQHAKVIVISCGACPKELTSSASIEDYTDALAQQMAKYFSVAYNVKKWQTELKRLIKDAMIETPSALLQRALEKYKDTFNVTFSAEFQCLFSLLELNLMPAFIDEKDIHPDLELIRIRDKDAKPLSYSKNETFFKGWPRKQICANKTCANPFLLREETNGQAQKEQFAELIDCVYESICEAFDRITYKDLRLLMCNEYTDPNKARIENYGTESSALADNITHTWLQTISNNPHNETEETQSQSTPYEDTTKNISPKPF